MPWGKRDGEARATRVRLTEGGANPDRRSNLFTVTRRLHTVFKVMWHIFKLKLKVKVNLKGDPFLTLRLRLRLSLTLRVTPF